MRFFVVVLIIAITRPDCFSQWQQAYPLTSDLFDVAVPAPGKVFILSADIYQTVIYQSSDSAKTWKKSSPFTQEQTLHLIFTDSLTGYTPSYRAVYKTVDGAKTWRAILLPEGLQDPLSIVFPTKNTGYIVFSNDKIVKTTDAGETWQLLTKVPPATDHYYKMLAFSDPQHGYVTIDRKLYKTSDGGANWTYVPLNIFVYRVCAVSQDVAFITDGYQTMRTIDGGDTWNQVVYTSSEVIQSVDPGTILFLSSYGTVYKSSDGGASIGHVYQSAFHFMWKKVDSSGQFVCAIGSDYSILTSRDGGSTWKINNIKPQHGEFGGVHFTNDNEGILISDHAGILRTDDSAKSWYYSEVSMGRDDFSQIAFAHADTGIFVVTNNYAYTTYDGGKSIFYNDWTPPIQGHLSTKDFEMVSANIIYSVGVNGHAAKSIDGGKNWTPFTLNVDNQLNAIKCIDAKTCHAAGLAGIVISTWDGGEHWKIHNLDVNNDLKAIAFLNSTTGFIGGGSGMILRTIDGGQTWNKTDTPANWSVISFEFISDQKGYAITEGGEILRTDDGGVNWRLKDNLPLPGSYSPSYLKATFMRDTINIYGISSYLISRWTPIKEEEEPDDVTAVQELNEQQLAIFPNPSQQRLNFVHEEPIDEVIITDVRGTTVRHVIGDIQYIDIGDVSPGPYIVRIRQRKYTTYKHIIKL